MAHGFDKLVPGADRHDLTGPGEIEFSGPRDHIQDLTK